MKVLLTGATGYLGAAIADALVSAGHTVHGLARTAEKAALLAAKGVIPVEGDLGQLEGLKSAAAAADGVIHAAGSWGPDIARLDAQAVEAMLSVLEGSHRPFLYTSGVWVMGDTGGRMNGEISAIHPPPLVAWRPAVEEKVLESSGRKVRSVVLRPGTAFGRGGGGLRRFFESARLKGTVRVVGDGENHWSTVHVEDLADLYRRAVEDAPSGEMFIACAGMPQPVKRIAHAVAAAAGVPGRVDFVPVEQARQEMGAIAECLAMDCKAGSTKAVRYFGWSPKKPYIFDEIERGSYGLPHQKTATADSDQ